MSRYRPPRTAGTPLITAAGEARLRAELHELWNVRRPQVTQAVSEAAALGDRSENAEYIYGKKMLREIDSQIRREWPYRRIMLEPLEIAGVDAFRESGVLVKARAKVRAGEQWKVGREFNRRIKRRFDQLGIELPVPQQKVVFDGGKGEDAAPLPEPVRRAVGET